MTQKFTSPNPTPHVFSVPNTQSPTPNTQPNAGVRRDYVRVAAKAIAREKTALGIDRVLETPALTESEKVAALLVARDISCRREWRVFWGVSLVSFAVTLLGVAMCLWAGGTFAQIGVVLASVALPSVGLFFTPWREARIQAKRIAMEKEVCGRAETCAAVLSRGDLLDVAAIAAARGSYTPLLFSAVRETLTRLLPADARELPVRERRALLSLLKTRLSHRDRLDPSTAAAVCLALLETRTGPAAESALRNARSDPDERVRDAATVTERHLTWP